MALDMGSNGKRPGVSGLLESFFRHQHGRVIAALLRTLGSRHLDLAEGAVQEALLRALRVWPMRGIPDEPESWLLLVARNYAIDQLRKSSRARDLRRALERERDGEPATRGDNPRFAGELNDDQLAMMFMCCDPAIEHSARVSLTLKVVSGFSTAEISRAFFVKEATIAQRIVRAKRRISTSGRPLAIPEPAQLSDRLDAVLSVLYLVFNEGYTHRDETEKLRDDLCQEALRLSGLLANHPTISRPRVHALRSLMLLQSSRLAARQDDGGWLLPIQAQDRARWDRVCIAKGMSSLALASTGHELSDYHLLAGIAACHATSPSWEQTDWRLIVSLYDKLVAGRTSFVLELNRAVAVSMLHGPQAGLRLLEHLDTSAAVARYHHVAAARADFYRRLGRQDEARAAFERAAALAPNESERRYLLECALACHSRASDSELKH